MTNDKQRERLVELIESTRYWGSGTSEEIADCLLEKGVIVPPYKVGQDIYTIQGGEVTKHFVIEVARHNNGKTYCKYVPYDKKGNVQWFYVQSSFTEDAIGKTVFLTKEEAEQALNNVQNENSCEGGGKEKGGVQG